MRRYIGFTVVFFLVAGLFAQHAVPSLEPLFLYESQGETLTGEDCIRAGLEFSLCPEESEAGRAVLLKYAELEAEVLSPEVAGLPVMEKGEKILTLMYERVLSQYSSNQTRIDVMFLNGTYNCVSSSVLYFALARAAGLQVTGQETPQHAFCTLHTDGKKIDVETTNPSGFNPGVKKVVEKTERSTRYFMVPKKYYSGRKEVGEHKFVSLVGRNMVSMMNDKRDFDHAVPLSVACMVFASADGKEARAATEADFYTMAGNYAVELDQRRGESEQALVWLESVSARWGISQELEKKYNTIAYNCAVNYLKAKDYDSAKRAFEEHRLCLTQKNALDIEIMIFNAWLDDESVKMPPEEAIAFLHEARENPLSAEKKVASRLDSLEEYTWFRTLKPVFDRGDYLAAASIADEGLRFVPRSKQLNTIRNQCLQNHAVDVHNAFADLANAGRYEEAIAVVQDGLKVNPNSSMLKNDLKKVQDFLKKK